MRCLSASKGKKNGTALLLPTPDARQLHRFDFPEKIGNVRGFQESD